MTTIAPTVHATCVSLGDHAVLLRGPSGSGKSDLALRLTGSPPPCFASPHAQAMLVADDRVLLRAEDGRLIASAPPHIAGKLEARGVGVVDIPFRQEAQVILIADLMHFDAISRLPPPPWPLEDVLGVPIPRLSFDPFEVSAPQKLWLAMRQLA